MKINKGFTLIELLVVVAVISLLSSIVMSSVSAARSRAEETRIVQSIRSFQQALEMYKNEKGYYPRTQIDIGYDSGTYHYTLDAINRFTLENIGSDFINFSKYMDLNNAFKSSNLPRDVLISYHPAAPSEYEGLYGGASMLFTCGQPVGGNYSQLFNKIKNGMGYTISVAYGTSKGGVFNRLPETYMIFEGVDEDYENTAAYPYGAGYFNTNKTACFINN